MEPKPKRSNRNIYINDINIKPFTYPDNYHKNILIIGQRGCGKTRIAKEILSVVEPKHNFIFNPTNHYFKEYSHAYNSISNLMDNFKNVPVEDSKCVIFEQTDQQLFDNKSIKTLFYNTLHLRTTFIQTLLYPVYTNNPCINTNFDYVYFYCPTHLHNIKQFYKQYCNRTIDVDIFLTIVNTLRQYNYFLVFDIKNNQFFYKQ